MHEKHHEQEKLLRDSEVTTTNNSGLINGASGKMLALLELYRQTGDERHKPGAIDLIRHIFASVNVGAYSDMSFGTGITGFAWALQSTAGQWRGDLQIDMEDFDNLIGSRFNKSVRHFDFDYLSGHSGYALYFLEKRGFEKELSIIVGQLYRTTESNRQSRISFSGSAELRRSRLTKVEYLGLAHGLAGAMVLLAKIASRDIERNKCMTMLRHTFGYLAGLKRPAGSASMFPFDSGHKCKGSDHMLAWCHGDLSVAYGIYLAGYLTGDDELRSAGLSLLTELVQSGRGDSYPADADFFCHGRIGLAHMYARIYNYSGNPLFKEEALKWYNRINFDRPVTGMDEKEEAENTGLLYGREGIMLSRLSLENDVEPAWDRCLLLS